MNILSAALAVGLALGGACVGFGLRQKSAELAQTQVQLRSLAEQVEQARQDASATQASRSLVQQMLAAPPAPAPPLAAPAQPAQKVAPRPRGPEVLVEQIGASFGQEGADPAWSGLAKEAVQGRLAAQLSDPSLLRSLDCRRSLCRIELGREDPAQLTQVLQQVLGEPGNPLFSGAFSVGTPPDRRGAPVTVAYVFRHGSDLPRLE